jgi:exodeoxyribonuclease VII large subunit
MTDAPNNLPELTVSELATALKRTVEDRFGLVRVRGEISGLKIAASGHAYLALKDDVAVLDGVMWKGSVNMLRFRPEDGLEVICTGKLTTYPGRSKYQIIIDRMEPAGVGALMALLEERKRKLAAEGLFDAHRKKPIPYLPQKIGIITSPTGAVIRDILHRLADRFPRDVLLWPVLVQGESAAAQIAAAIAGFDAMGVDKPDVLIVARGGGSVEDLWAFNEEIVLRAVAHCSIPLISAVGHETDTTLIDFVSDLRAPTPTAAAEMAVPVRVELRSQIVNLNLRLHRALHKNTEQQKQTVQALARALPHPRDLIGLKQQRFDDAAGRLPRALGSGVAVWRGRLERARVSPQLLTQSLARRIEASARAGQALDKTQKIMLTDKSRSLKNIARVLETLSPKRTLARGYAIVRDAQGALITSKAQAKINSPATLEFQDGEMALGIKSSGPKQSTGKPEQSSLF